jgi:hypothetical protein
MPEAQQERAGTKVGKPASDHYYTTGHEGLPTTLPRVPNVWQRRLARTSIENAPDSAGRVQRVLGSNHCTGVKQRELAAGQLLPFMDADRFGNDELLAIVHKLDEASMYDCTSR